MTNFDTAREALETSMNSSGSAMEEHGKWSESLEARLNSLAASWQALSQSFMNSDFLKGALDIIIKLVDALTVLTDTFGGFGVVALGLAGKGIWNHWRKGKKSITDVANAVEELTNVVRNNANATDEAAKANERNATAEQAEAQATAQSAAAETAENAANVTGAATDTADAAASKVSANAEKEETTSTAATVTAQAAEIKSDAAGVVSDTADANASLASASAEQKEAVATALTNTAQLTEATGDLADTATDAAGGILKTTAATKALSSASGTAATSSGGLVKSIAGLASAHPYAAIAVAAITAITVAVGGYYLYQKKQAEELAKEVDELTESYEQNHDELLKLKGDYDTSNESSMISRYEKLSKGVDGLGRNVSLTADEYSEYQSIIDRIAEQNPSLVAGYNDEGKAILKNVDSVEALSKAYQNLIHEQNQAVLSNENLKKIQDDWENTINQANGYDGWESIGNLFSFDGFFGGETDDYDMKTDTAEWLRGLNSKTSQKDIKKYLDSDLAKTKEIIQFLQNNGYDVNQWDRSNTNKVANVLKEALDNDLAGIKGALDDYYDGFDEAVSKYKTIATSLLSDAFNAGDVIEGWNYGGITEELQNIAYKTVNSLDFDFLNNLSQQGKTIEQWTNELLNQLNTVGKTHGEYIANSFDLKTQFNSGDIDYGERT